MKIKLQRGAPQTPPLPPPHLSTTKMSQRLAHYRQGSLSTSSSLRHSVSNNSMYSTVNMSQSYEDIDQSRSSLPSIAVNGIDNTGTRSEAAARRRSSMRAVYPALMSAVVLELWQRIPLQNRTKNGIEYRGCVDGREIVNKLMKIAHTKDRRLALRLGRALENQRLFHDVSYEKRLIDSNSEIYQFNEHFLSVLSQNAPSSGTLTVSSMESNNSDHDSASSLLVRHNPQNYRFRLSLASLQQQDVELFASGVFTELTRCYTSTCAVSREPCYSPSCPKKLVEEQKQHRERQESEDSGVAIYPTSTSSSENEYIRPRLLWMDTVSPKVLNSVSHEERKRQEAIFELIQTEDNFVRDMEYVHEKWILPIRNSNIIPDERKRDAFIRAAFANVMEVHVPHAELTEAFHQRQQEHPVVPHIGDILLQFVDRFDPLIKYSANQWDSRYAMEHERSVNPEFEKFVNATEAHPSSLGMPIKGYLSRPTTRAGQYTLLLNKILKYTPDDNPDKTAIPEFIEKITDLMNRMNAETGRRKNRFDLRCIHQNLRFREKTDAVDLRLLDQEREIKLQDTLRKSSNPESAGFEIILFDHYLVVAKVKVENADRHYTIQRVPIPIDLLVLSETEPGRTRRANSILPYIPGGHAASTGAHMPLRTSTDSTTVTSAAANSSSKNGFPIVFRHLGRKDSEHFTLYTPSQATRKLWFDTVQALQEERDRKFSIFNASPAIIRYEFFVDCKINHMSTFNNGRQYVLATDHGIYVGHTRVSSKPRRVLAIERVTQVQALEHAQKLLVLADKVLWEYPLHVVNGNPRDRPQRRKILTKVPFFHAAPCVGRTLVCVPRITTLKTTINVFEAIGLEEYNRRHRGDQGADIPAPLDLPPKRFKQCSIPSEVWDIELTHTKMFLTTARGVEIVDMKGTRMNTTSRRLLNMEDPHLSFITDREKEAMNIKNQQKHIPLFRTPQGEHLLCYDEFAFFINGHGNRVRPDFLIEWEASPEAFAFIYPYVLAFEHTFIEVRNIHTGKREQIIRGTNIKSLSHHSTYKSSLPFVFGVMTDPENDCYQYIFRLERVARNEGYSI